jgi:hypothetical protein
MGFGPSWRTELIPDRDEFMRWGTMTVPVIKTWAVNGENVV